jgi:hypothetical protein
MKGYAGGGLAAALLVAAMFWGLHAGESDARAMAERCGDEEFGTGMAVTRKESCYNEAFRAYAREHGAEGAFETLWELQKIDTDTESCHFLGHGIGYGSYERSPREWRSSFMSVPQECSYGAMHGILELALADLPGGLTSEVLPTICGPEPKTTCNHIVGHLTLIEARGSIPDALRLCTSLPDEGEYAECASGVFMEYETATNLVAHGLADETYYEWQRRLPELKALCDAQDAVEAIQCWRMLAYVITDAYGHDAEDSFAACGEGPNEAARSGCVILATGILVTHPGITNAERRRICEAFPGDFMQCLDTAVQSLAATLPPDSRTAEEFCAMMPASERPGVCDHIGS